MIRPVRTSFVLALLCCCSPPEVTSPLSTIQVALTTTTLGDPFPGLPAPVQARFDTGKDIFSEVEDAGDGLGPVFNGNSCAQCHSAPAVGGSGVQIETRFGAVVGSSFDPLASLGGSLIQNTGISIPGCMLSGEVVPPQATVFAGRRTTPLFGLGLVDAVPAADLIALAAAEPLATRGKVSLVLDPVTHSQQVGRFGWKAQVASLATFSADAYLNEMGITSPVFPAENCPQGDCSLLATCDTVADPEDDGTDVNAFQDFMTFLAPPAAPTLTSQARAGLAHFEHIGCNDCHAESLKTGPNAIAALDRVTFRPYSDFLLHDMGPLGDGIVQNGASGREMRTSPLWGVSRQSRFLHDGRAATLTAAIAAHDGQAAAARDGFAGLSAPEQAQLLAFLNAL